MIKIKKLIILSLLFNIYYSLYTPATASEPPGRIISLAPSITEIIYALGLEDRLVGVTTYCDYPEDAKKKPKVGGMINPSIEAVVSLKPDIVIMTTDGNTKEFEERLRLLRVKTFVFKARRLSELSQGIREVGVALGVRERAEALALEIESAVNTRKALSVQRSAKVSKRRTTNTEQNKKRVLFIIWPEPLIVAGSGTAIDDAIKLLGAENVASNLKVPYPKYSIEEIIHQNPNVILFGIGNMNMKDISEGLLKKIAMVKAVKNGSVFYMSDRLHRLGPRIVEGIEEMAGYLK